MNEQIQGSDSIEIAILGEDITFYPLQKDIQGKFFIPILTPNVTMTTPSQERSRTGVTSNFFTLKIPTFCLLPFVEDAKIEGFGTETIVDYDKRTHTNMVCKGRNTSFYALTFSKNKYTIPKNTKFLVAFQGGRIDDERLRIIGVF